MCDDLAVEHEHEHDSPIRASGQPGGAERQEELRRVVAMLSRLARRERPGQAPRSSGAAYASNFASTVTIVRPSASA